MSKRVAFVLALAALAFPAVAAAKTYEVGGRLGLLGRSAVSADLTAGAGARPVRIAVLGGSLNVTSVSDDVKVRCRSRADGKAATSCTGKAVLAIVSGSHFRIEASGKLFLLGVPAGYSGTVDADTAKQCGKEINCRRVVQRLRRHANANGNGGNARNGGNAGNGDAGGDAGDGITAEPGTDESLAQLQAALAALNGGK